MTGEKEQGVLPVSNGDWQKASLTLKEEAVQALELQYIGEGTADLLELAFEKMEDNQ